MSEKKFVGYEYQDVVVKRSMLSMYTDAYENFGWVLEGTFNPIGKVDSVTLQLKRDRQIRNKPEIRRLQRQFETYASQIQSLETAKYVKASAVAYMVGILGTVSMAGSVFAVTSNMIALCVVLGALGFAGWSLSYLAYRKIRKNKEAEITPQIDEKYDEIYEVCQKANLLLTN